jgi:trehalose-phosphatase
MRVEPAVIAATIAGRCRDAHLLLLFDFDGTLVEFQADPAAVWLPGHRRDLIERLVARPHTSVAVVSGRRLEDVRARTRLTADLYFAGLHGLEIAGQGERFVHPAVESTTGIVHAVAAALRPRIADVPGVFVEDKGLSIAMHYREADPAMHPTAVAHFDAAAAPALLGGALRVMRGAFVLELLPNIDWNKGHAARWIIERTRARHGRVLPVYFGDDVTDEDALSAVEADGIGVAASERVGAGHYRVNGPADIERILRSLADTEIVN